MIIYAGLHAVKKWEHSRITIATVRQLPAGTYSSGEDDCSEALCRLQVQLLRASATTLCHVNSRWQMWKRAQILTRPMPSCLPTSTCQPNIKARDAFVQLFDKTSLVKLGYRSCSSHSDDTQCTQYWWRHCTPYRHSLNAKRESDWHLYGVITYVENDCLNGRHIILLTESNDTPKKII